MPGISYGDGGLNRAALSLTYGDSGVNRTLTEVWYGDAGVNRKVWPVTSGAQISDQSISDSGVAGTRIAGYRINASGIAERRVFGTYTTLETWLLTGVVGDYEVRATLMAGTTPTGTLGTWLACSTSPEWQEQDAAADLTPVTGQLLIEIRTIVGGIAQDSATIDLSADKA